MLLAPRSPRASKEGLRMILVDHAIYHWLGRKWCHMVSDTGEDELHRFAERLGMRRGWFQNHPKMPHYDIDEVRRALAIQYGAVASEGAQLLAWVHVPDDSRAAWRAELRLRYPHPLEQRMRHSA